MTSADPPARAGRDTARRVIPLFRPYRGRVVIVVGLIVLTSTIGIINPLLIQAVFNRCSSSASCAACSTFTSSSSTISNAS